MTISSSLPPCLTLIVLLISDVHHPFDFSATLLLPLTFICYPYHFLLHVLHQIHKFTATPLIKLLQLFFPPCKYLLYITSWYSIQSCLPSTLHFYGTSPDKVIGYYDLSPCSVFYHHFHNSKSFTEKRIVND